MSHTDPPVAAQTSGAHPDVETLADLDEGLLAPEQATTVTAHVDGCPTCRSTLSALSGVPALLAGLPDVGPVPTDVAARLDGRLREELVVLAPGEAAVTVMPAAAHGSRRRPRENRYLQVAAAVVLLLAVTAVGVSAVINRHGNGSTASSASSDSAGREAAAPKTLSSTFDVVSSGTNYTASTVTGAIPGLLLTRGTRVSTPAAGSVAPQTDNSTDPERLRDGTALGQCVTAIAGTPATPLVVDIARYESRPATVVVLPTPDDPGHLDVWVVRPTCNLANAQVLLFQRVVRP